jgi:hypothetical protein
MSLFQSILSQLQDKFLKESDRCADIARIVSEILHIPIVPEQVIYKKGNITLQVSPTIKMAIRIKEEELKTLLRKESIEVFSIK